MLHVRSGLRMLCRRSCRFQWEGFSVRFRLTGHNYSQGLCPSSGVRVGACLIAFLAPCSTRFHDYYFCVHGKIINSVAQPPWTARKLGARPLPSHTLCVTESWFVSSGWFPSGSRYRLAHAPLFYPGIAGGAVPGGARVGMTPSGTGPWRARTATGTGRRRMPEAVPVAGGGAFYSGA